MGEGNHILYDLQQCMIKNSTSEESAHKKNIEGKTGFEFLGFKGNLV